MNWNITKLNVKISQILPKESGSKWKKNDTQQEYFWHLNTQPNTQGVPEVKKGGLNGGTSLLTLTELPSSQPIRFLQPRQYT